MIPGCTYAGITLIPRHGPITAVAPTDQVANQIHVIQNELGEGPCLSTIYDHAVYQVDDLPNDDRWPRFARRVAAETPVASMLSFRLFTSEEAIGALDLYADKPQAYDAHARAIGTVLAAHAAIAMFAAREHKNAENLEIALHNSRQIGIAIGILMSRKQLSQDQAFNFLVNVSQRLNRKLHDIAGMIVAARELPSGLDSHRS